MMTIQQYAAVAALTLPLATIFTVCVSLWVPAAASVYHFWPWPWFAATFALAYGCSAMLVRRGRAEAGARLMVATAFLSTTATGGSARMLRDG